MKIESLASGFQSLILQPAFTKCIGAVNFFFPTYVVKKENDSSKSVGGAPGTVMPSFTVTHRFPVEWNFQKF